MDSPTNAPSPSSSSPRPTPPNSSSLDPGAARQLLADTQRVREIVRADRRGVAIPLFVLGPLTIGYALLLWIEDRILFGGLPPGGSESFGGGDVPTIIAVTENYWATLGAVGLLVIGVWFGWRSRRTGAGSGAGAWIAGGVGTFLLVAAGGSLVLRLDLLFAVSFLLPSIFMSVPLLLISLRRRNWRLGLWVVVFGVTTALARLGFFTNRFGDLLTALNLHDVVSVHAIVQADRVTLLTLGLALLFVAVRANRADRRISP